MLWQDRETEPRFAGAPRGGYEGGFQGRGGYDGGYQGRGGYAGGGGGGMMGGGGRQIFVSNVCILWCV